MYKSSIDFVFLKLKYVPFFRRRCPSCHGVNPFINPGSVFYLGSRLAATMVNETEDEHSSYSSVLRIMSRRRTWVCLFVLAYGFVLASSWNLLKSILVWYKHQSQITSAPSCRPAVYASLLLGALFGVVSMVSALAVAIPATMVIWIAVMVLLTFFGKPRKALVGEGRKVTIDILKFVFKILLKEGNIVAVVCAILGYFILVTRNPDID